MASSAGRSSSFRAEQAWQIAGQGRATPPELRLPTQRAAAERRGAAVWPRPRFIIRFDIDQCRSALYQMRAESGKTDSALLSTRSFHLSLTLPVAQSAPLLTNVSGARPSSSPMTKVRVFTMIQASSTGHLADQPTMVLT